MKKFFTILAILLAVTVVGGAILFALAFYGNPVSWFLAKQTATEYLEENYNTADYTVERVFYNFKFGCYEAYIVSPSSIDSSFYITLGMDGRFLYDSYESDVLNKGNVVYRIDNAYRNAVKTALESADFSYVIDIGYGEICFVYENRPDDTSVPSYAIPVAELVLDATYNTSEMGKRAGHLVIYVKEDTPSEERLCEILLDIRQKMDALEIGFVSIDCILQSTDEGNQERIEVREFSYADIYEENLTERVRDANDAARAYWEEMDKEKGI